MNTSAIETLMGTLVIAIAAGFLVFAYSAGNLRPVEGYRVTAEFDRIDGVDVGTDVRIAGIKIGSVVAQSLDPKNYLATVVMSINRSVKLPEDSSVKVALDGLLGGAYLAIQPGGSEMMVADGGRLTDTQPSIDVVGLLGQAIFSPGASTPDSAPEGP